MKYSSVKPTAADQISQLTIPGWKGSDRSKSDRPKARKSKTSTSNQNTHTVDQ